MGMFSHWEATHQSNSFSTILDRMPPCGVPLVGQSQLIAGGGVALIGITLIPPLRGLFG